MKKRVLSLLFIVVGAICNTQLFATEGMWMVQDVSTKNIERMRALGCYLEKSDIYKFNTPSLSDAIPIFGAGCSSEVISSEGLLLTNHHCGYGAVQKLSSVEHDYLKDGFWAKEKGEELENKDLAVTFIREIIDVTPSFEILKTFADTKEMKKVRDSVSASISKKLLEEHKKEGFNIFVRSFYNGNKYYLYVTEVFTDVRLAGVPPTSIGKFGGETDNWMWPRHTGDFALFRIYANKDNKPAAYSKDNVPYKPVKVLPISLKGIKEGDYSMIMGFPGRTNRYMTSFEVENLKNNENPIRIFVRGIRQDILKEDMLKDDKVRIQYASKYAGSSNYWKNSIGMNLALEKLDVITNKKELEKEFLEWYKTEPELNKRFGNVLDTMDFYLKKAIPNKIISQYITECFSRSCEITTVPVFIKNKLDSLGIADFSKKLGASRGSLENFFKDYNLETDKKVIVSMLKIFKDSLKYNSLLPSFYDVIDGKKFKGDYGKYVDFIFTKTIFSSLEKIEAFFANEPSMDVILKDPVYIMYKEIDTLNKRINKELVFDNFRYIRAKEDYMEAYLKWKGAEDTYPDANFTQRFTYGTVKGYEPKDGEWFNYYTTLKGVMEKEDETNPEFVVPAKLKELYNAKDFGRYANDKGEMPLAFLSDNDITGGNSGSPVLNKKGELIGTAFDGNWEAMSGDILFEKNMQRTISVDIRYTLFIVDKFAGAANLIKEMTIVK